MLSGFDYSPRLSPSDSREQCQSARLGDPPSERRLLGELARQFNHVQVVLGFKCTLAEMVLLHMMEVAQADGPPIGGLKPHASVGATPHVRAFDRKARAATDRAAVISDPRSMPSTGPGCGLACLKRQTIWKAQLRHALSLALPLSAWLAVSASRAFAGVSLWIFAGVPRGVSQSTRQVGDKDPVVHG